VTVANKYFSWAKKRAFVSELLSKIHVMFKSSASDGAADVVMSSM
jgi:hypothetical protein